MDALDRPEGEAAEANLDSAIRRTVQPTGPGTPHDPYAALRYRDFRLLVAGRFVSSLGEQMLTLAMGWELYDRTGNAFFLGLVGLVEIIPIFALSLPAGHWADKYNRRRITLGAEVLYMACAGGIALLTLTRGPLFLVYGFLFFIGVARALSNPATSSLLPQTCPPEVFSNAATWNSSAWQSASVIGPALSGVLIAIFKSAAPVFIISTLTSLTFAVLIALLHLRPRDSKPNTDTVRDSLREGVSFIRHTKIILAAITLDMFAVLLGGATALLPVFQKDILHVDEVGLGMLRTAPSIGALAMAFLIATRPPFQHAGRTLLLAVIGFGVATIVFGLSSSFWLSLLMLALLGALDNISVVIRQSLVLIRTPDAMRGRISAVNGMFIGASNELGAFESGATASLFGPVASVVFGGIGTILVVIAIALHWPELSRLGALDQSSPELAHDPTPEIAAVKSTA